MSRPPVDRPTEPQVDKKIDWIAQTIIAIAIGVGVALALALGTRLVHYLVNFIIWNWIHS